MGNPTSLQRKSKNLGQFFQIENFWKISILKPSSNRSLSKLIIYQSPIKLKRLRALRGYFGPPMRSKNKSCSSQVSPY